MHNFSRASGIAVERLVRNKINCCYNKNIVNDVCSLSQDLRSSLLFDNYTMVLTVVVCQQLINSLDFEHVPKYAFLMSCLIAAKYTTEGLYASDFEGVMEGVCNMEELLSCERLLVEKVDFTNMSRRFLSFGNAMVRVC